MNEIGGNGKRDIGTEYQYTYYKDDHPGSERAIIRKTKKCTREKLDVKMFMIIQIWVFS